MLRRLGYDVPATVGTGELAIQTAATNQPDLILMDIQLRGNMDGVVAAESIKANQDVPIVYLTANSDEATLQRAKVTDPFGFMIKPFEERAIQAGIEVALYKHKAEKQNREREQWLSTTLRSIADAVVTTDANGKVTFLNAVAESLSGWTHAESLGRHYTEIFSIIDETTRKTPEDSIAGALSNGISRTGVNHTLLITRDGTERHIEHSVAPIRQDDTRVTGCVIVFADVSAQLLLEAELRQSQKMEAIGKLAGSIAHDFNNAITAVMGYASLILSKLPTGSQLHTDAGQIIKAAEHSARLTRQLLLFSRKQVVAPVVLDLGTAVKEMHGLLRRLIRENISLKISATGSLWQVMADPGHIEQLVLNMAVNGRDAMQDGGHLSIEVMNATLRSEDAAQIRGAREGEFVCIRITDNGTGMSKEVIEHVFEPFFTTKAADKGTGLGLSTCEGIVRQTDGFIQVSSKLGAGTAFTIYFPRTVQTHQEDASSMPALDARSGNETILIVEDEEVLRMLAARMLEEIGYNMLEASNGFEALKLLESRGAPVDLIVTDMVMPEMSGRELIERVRAKGNPPKVLFMSGYTDDDIIREGVAEAEIAFLQKPFTSDILVRKVRETLDAA